MTTMNSTGAALGPVTLSVDGRHGRDVAENRQSNYVPRVEDLQLAEVGAFHSLDGSHGRDAQNAVSGAPGGHLEVQVKIVDDNIGVQVLQQVGKVKLPSQFEVRKNLSLLIQARGGDGQEGLRGESGGNGHDGPDGAPATEQRDGEPGWHGGHGGNAGSGSDGGDGGDGGTIVIEVDEREMFLLMAVTCDVSPGRPGRAVGHGVPGRGGQGGKGGAGHKWKEFQRMDYKCTKACQGDPTYTGGGSNALVGPTTGYNNNDNDRFEVSVNGDVQVRLFRDGVSDATNSRRFNVTNTTAVPLGTSWQQALVSQIMSAPGAESSALVKAVQMPSFICRCRGGPSHCLGCKAKPVYSDLHRPPGPDGRPGAIGRPCPKLLTGGKEGLPGTALIKVYHVDGNTSTYNSVFSFELVGFELIDANHDGIFEPGDDLFINMIRIRNTGGMPTPKTDIPIHVIETDWLTPYPDDEPVYLPHSIGPGEIGYAVGTLRAFVNYVPATIRATDVPFQAQTTVTLRSVMPFLDVELPNFGMSKSVKIEYPIELGCADYLQTVPQGGATLLKWKVSNKSSKDYGEESDLNREINTRITLGADSGMSFREESQHGRISTPLPMLSREFECHQVIQVDRDAVPYVRHEYTVSLFLSIPSDEREKYPLRLIQEKKYAVKVSDGWHYNPRASYLLVTNSATTSDALDKWKTFIEEDLLMQADVYNLTLKGSFQLDGEQETVLSKYAGKTIIFLCNTFEFLGRECTVFDFMAPSAIAQETALLGTSVVFSGAITDNAWLQSFLRPALELQETKHENLGDIVETIQAREDANIRAEALTTYTIPVRQRSILLGRRKSQMLRQTKKTAEMLRKDLPQARFLIAPVTDGDKAHIRILQGIPRSSVVFTTAPPSVTRTMTRQNTHKLANLDAFIGIATMSLNERLRLISQPLNGDQEAAHHFPSGFLREAALLTITRECQQEMISVIKSHTRDGWLKPSENIMTLFPLLHSILTQVELTESIQHVIRDTLAAGTFITKGAVSARLLHWSQKDNVCRLLLKTIQDARQITFPKSYLTTKSDATSETLAKMAKLCGFVLQDFRRVLAFASDLIKDDEVRSAGLTSESDFKTRTQMERQISEKVTKTKELASGERNKLMVVYEEDDSQIETETELDGSN